MLSGKLAAEVICDKEMGRSGKGLKDVHKSMVGKIFNTKEPVGIVGTGATVYGGGKQGNFENP